VTSKKFTMAAVMAVMAVAGCSQNPPLQSSADLTVTSVDALPAPTRADLQGVDRASGIGAFDKLVVNVFGVEELSGKFQTDANGRVSIPLAGTLNASGKTPEELAAEITTALRRHYVRDPQVTVNFEEMSSQTVTVDGEVREAGNYPLTGNMTLLRAVAAAKGPGEFAKLDDVVILRTVKGQRYAALYNLTAIRRGLYADPPIYANDVVQVGDSPGRRLFRTIVQASGLITAPLIIALQRR
jgi:polysaccharide export outer membrane protein